MIVLVVGAGYTGRRLVDRLGDRAIALGRSEPGEGRLDLDAGERLRVALPDEYSIVYTVPPAPNAAVGALLEARSGSNQSRFENRSYEAPVRSSTAASCSRLAALLPQLVPPPARIVYLSTTGVYGDRRGALVGEADEPNPETERAGRRIVAERQLADWCRGHGSDLVVLRVPGIYGPGRLGTERLRAGNPVLSECDANPGNRIHVEDLASCCIAALSSAVPAGIYNVGDGDERSSTWFAAEVARQAGLPEPPTVSRAEAEATFPESRLSFLRESRRIDTTRMRTVLGVVPKYADPADGIAASLAEEGSEYSDPS